MFLGKHTNFVNSLINKSQKPCCDYNNLIGNPVIRYDLPAMLQHLMAVTGQDRFHYIGHSMGTLSYYTACNYHDWIGTYTSFATMGMGGLLGVGLS